MEHEPAPPPAGGAFLARSQPTASSCRTCPPTSWRRHASTRSNRARIVGDRGAALGLPPACSALRSSGCWGACRAAGWSRCSGWRALCSGCRRPPCPAQPPVTFRFEAAPFPAQASSCRRREDAALRHRQPERGAETARVHHAARLLSHLRHARTCPALPRQRTAAVGHRDAGRKTRRASGTPSSQPARSQAIAAGA